jgi:carbohydrate diacid regulator
VRALVAPPGDGDGESDAAARAHLAGLEARARELGVDLRLSRTVLLLEPHAGGTPTLLREAQRALEAAPQPPLTAILEPAQQLLVLAAEPAGPDAALRALGPLRPRLRAGVGGRFPELGARQALLRSHRTAQAALRAAVRAGLTERRFEQDSTVLLLADLPDDWRLEEVTAPWRRLCAADRHGVLAATFAAYAVHGGDLSACGVALAVHRNTLRYRLDRIAATAGADPRDVLGATRLLLGAVRDPGWAHLVRAHTSRPEDPR